MKKIASLFPVLFFLYTLKAQTCITIDPTLPPSESCNFKIGYRLIFQDEFNSFNSDSWDISSPGDDQANYGDPKFCEEPYKTVVNASNSFVSNGELHLQVREGEDMNVCDFSGGEVKTFNNYPGGMRHWKMYTNSYLEARIKIAYCSGTASSFWLYGGIGGSSPANGRFFEIDMFETGAQNPSQLGTNIHYGHSYEPHHYTDPKKFVFKDEDGDDVILSDQFLTFGIELTDSQINMYLNGVQYATYNFAPFIPNNPISYFKQPVLFNIRFGESSSLLVGNPSDCDELPKEMLVDYVRLYRKNTVEAVKFANNNSNITLCTHGPGTNVQVVYYPGVTYQWDQLTPNYFNFEVNPNGLTECNCARWWVSLQPGTPPGDYAVPLAVFLPCGGTETKTLHIKVEDNTTPNTPTKIYLIRGNGVFRPGVWKANNTTAYQWSSDGGQSWETVGNLPLGSYNIWATHFILPQITTLQYKSLRSRSK